MLVNRGRAVEPEIDVDIKSGAGEERDWGITETAFDVLLLRKRDGGVYPTDNFPRVDARGGLASVNACAAISGNRASL